MNLVEPVHHKRDPRGANVLLRVEASLSSGSFRKNCVTVDVSVGLTFCHKKEHISKDMFSSSLTNDKNQPQIATKEKFFCSFSE